MPAANVPIVIDQGEDYTAQIIWTDADGAGQKLAAPIRMDIMGAGGQIVMSLTTPEVEAPDNQVPEITFSPDIGLIQIHIDKGQTAALPAGQYVYDMFCTINDGEAYAGNQQVRLLVGQVTVNKRITVM